MITHIRRSFAKLYNESKQNPRSRDTIKPHEKERFRLSPMVQIQLKESIDKVKSTVEHKPLAVYLDSSKSQLKKFKPPRFINSKDPSIEPKIYRYFKSQGVDQSLQSAMPFIQDNVLRLDNTQESVRNVLLTQEGEQFMQLQTHIKEQERRKQVQANDIRNLLPEFTKDISIESHLDSISFTASRTESISSDLSLLSPDNSLSTYQEKNESTGELISSKGVVDLSGRTDKLLTYAHLTHRELANYICYNTTSADHALIIYSHAKDSSQCTTDNKCRILQKAAIMNFSTPILQYDTLYDLVRDLMTNITEITKKDAADTIWSLGCIFKANRDKPQVVNHFIHKLSDRVSSYIPEMNSMNLAYLADGYRQLGIYLPKQVELILTRYTDLCNLTQSLNIKNSHEFPYCSPRNTTSHSAFQGFVDYTLPTAPITAESVIKTLKFLYNAPEHLRGSLDDLRITSAVILENTCLYELDIKMLLDSFTVFGLYGKGSKHPQVQSLMKSMSAQLKNYILDLSIRELNTIGNAVMNTGLFNATKLLENIEVRAIEALPLEKNTTDILNLYKLLIRWNVALNYEIDIDKEPWLPLIPYNPLHINLQDYLFTHKDSLPFTPYHKKQFKKVLSYIGQSISFEDEPSYSDLESVSKALYENSPLPQLTSKLPEMLNSLKSEEELAELLVGLASKSDSKTDWKYISDFVKYNLEELKNPGCIVGILWSLTVEGTTDIELLKNLFKKVDLKTLHKPNLVLMYQVYIELDNQIELPKELYKTCASVWKDILKEVVLYEDEKVLPNKVFTRDYFHLYPLQYYDTQHKSVHFIYNQDKFRNHTQYKIFSVMKKQLEKKGLTVSEHFLQN